MTGGSRAGGGGTRRTPTAHHSRLFTAVDVGNQDLIVGGAELLLRGFAGVDGLHAVPVFAQRDVEHLADGALVIAYKNASHARPPRLPPQAQTWALRPWRAGFP